MAKGRDSQRSRVYASEVSQRGPLARLYLGPSGHETTLADVRAYYIALTDRAWFRKRWTFDARRHLRLADGRGRVRAGASSSGVISLPRWSRTEDTLLHELAHVLAPVDKPGHGPEYARTYLTLLRYAVGKDAYDEQRRKYREHRVKVAKDSGLGLAEGRSGWTRKAGPESLRKLFDLTAQ